MGNGPAEHLARRPHGPFRPGARGGYGLDLQQVFPLHRVPQVQAGRRDVGTSYRQTVAARRRLKDINGVLESLNWCAGFPTPANSKSAREQSSADGQASAEARAAAGVDDFLNCDAIPSQRAAFLELLKGRGVYDVDTAGLSLASFTTVSAISMPTSTAGSPWLEDVAPSPSLHYLEKGMQRMLRTQHEFNETLAANPVTPYWDRTLLRNRRKYIRLVRALLGRGLVGMHKPQHVKGRVGASSLQRRQRASCA